MIEIQYLSGLTVSVTVAADPGTDATWFTDYPAIDWGDGSAMTTNATSGTYSHTYSSYDTYTITYTAMNNCGETATDHASVTLWECPTPTCSISID